MRIEVLFFQGCPNHALTAALVRAVVRDLAITASIAEVEVKDLSEAQRLRFLGSPTVQIDGVDIEVERRTDSDYSMSCRRYGKFGVPPRRMITAALTAQD